MTSPELVRELTSNASLLFERQLKLARIEAEQELKKAKLMGGLLAIAAATAYAGVILLLVAAALGIGVALQGLYWLGALLVAGAMLSAALLFGVIGWARRIRRPLTRTRDELSKEIQWARFRTT
jgi:hypothetical protein